MISQGNSTKNCIPMNPIRLFKIIIIIIIWIPNANAHRGVEPQFVVPKAVGNLEEAYGPLFDETHFR